MVWLILMSQAGVIPRELGFCLGLSQAGVIPRELSLCFGFVWVVFAFTFVYVCCVVFTGISSSSRPRCKFFCFTVLVPARAILLLSLRLVSQGVPLPSCCPSAWSSGLLGCTSFLLSVCLSSYPSLPPVASSHVCRCFTLPCPPLFVIPFAAVLSVFITHVVCMPKSAITHCSPNVSHPHFTSA